MLLGLIATAQAAPDALPRFDVEQSCTALVGTADPKAPMRNLCIQREQQAYAASGALWPMSSLADREKCMAVAERSRLLQIRVSRDLSQEHEPRKGALHAAAVPVLTS